MEDPDSNRQHLSLQLNHLKDATVSSQRCHSIISTMSQCHLNDVTVSSQQCHSIIATMPQYHLNNVTASCQRCHSIISEMSQYDLNDVTVSPQRCHSIISTMSQYHLKGGLQFPQQVNDRNGTVRPSTMGLGHDAVTTLVFPTNIPQHRLRFSGDPAPGPELLGLFKCRSLQFHEISLVDNAVGLFRDDRKNFWLVSQPALS